MSRFETRTILLTIAFPIWLAMTLGVSSCALYEDVEPLDQALAITDLEISPDPVRLELGQTTQVSVTSFDRAGEEVDISEVEWTSANTSVATVDEDGIVEAQAIGDTSITARVGEVTASVPVLVFTAVQRVEVSPDPVELDLGDKAQMSATVYGEDGSVVNGREIEWTSSDEAIATIDAEGEVTGVGPGDATIRAKTSGVTGTATVRVSTSVGRVKLDQTDVAIEVTQTFQLTALVYDTNDQVRDDRTVTWSSSKPDIASVDSSGLVEGLKGGQATIVAESGGKRAEASVTVDDPVAEIDITPSPASVGVGLTAQLTATLTDAGGNELSGRDVSWASDDVTVATVDDDGLVSGVSGGQVTVTATSEGVTDTVQLNVEDPVASVDVTPDPVTLAVPETQQLTATLKDAGGNVITGRSVTWRSDDTSIASVDANGIVTAKDAGTATINATAEGITGSALINVENPVATVEVTPATPSIEVATSVQLTAVAKNTRGNVVSGHTVTWTSSDPTVATVDASGTIEGVKGGTATISAQVDNITGTAEVTVNAPVRSVSVSAQASTIEVTETAQLSAELLDNGGNVLTGRTVSWTSADTAVASVDASGLVTANAGGTATIIAESEGVSDSIAITVENPPRSVDVTPDPASVDVGNTVQLSATPRDKGGNALTGFTAGWSSADSAIASVDSSGLVSGQKGGSVTITASIDDGSGQTITGTASVDVSAPVAVVTLDPVAVELFPGEQAQINVTLEDANGNTLSGRTVTWTSQDTSVATVDSSGLISALSTGSTTITAESEGVSETVALDVLEWTQISAGQDYTCGVVSSGDAYCWGKNSPDGILGNGTTDSGTDAAPAGDADSNVPSLVQGGHDFEKVATGFYHTCGLDTSGHAYCWGSNSAGHLGNGTTTPSAVPVAVSGSYTFTDIALGANHTCALDTSGNLYCWGWNQSGQLGLGSGGGSASTVPQRVPNLTFTEFSTGASHTCAISTAGDTYCWGAGGSGQIGDGNTFDRMSPTQVNSTEQFSVLVSGWDHVCAINASAHVYCWGANDYGELGDGTTNISASPILADSSRTYTALALGAGATCAVATNQDAYCWGFNGQGNLGTGAPTAPLSNPTLVTGGYSWSALSLGRQHSCGLASGQDDAFCWGDNEFGEVGNGANQDFLATPARVLTP